MKRIISVCALALFISASIIGCGGTTTSAPSGPPPVTGSAGGKDKMAKPDDTKKPKDDGKAKGD
jgi:hypothetical protein